MTMRRRRLNNRKPAGGGGQCWRWCRRLSSSSSWTCGWSTSRSRRCSTTLPPRRCRMSRGSSTCTPSCWPRCCCPPGGPPTASGAGRCFLAGLVVFGIASLGCAVAPELPALIACRALQAAGAAMLMPTSLGLALSVFPSHQRGTAVGVWAGVGAVAAGSGPVLGGLLVESSWRWIFLINVPVILATLAAAVAILPRRGDRGVAVSGLAGASTGWEPLLVLGAVGLVCTALTEAPGWPPSRTWPVLAAGLVLAAAFVAHIRRHPDPLVAPRLFSVRAFSAGAAGLVTYYTGFAAMLLGTTLLLTVQWHFSVLLAAASIAPAPITAGIVSPFSGRLSARFGMRSTVVAGARAFRGGWGLAAGQCRRRPGLRGGRAAEHAAVGRGQRAHPAVAVRLRRRRAASGAGVGVSGAGHGTPARFGPGCGDLRGRARRPPGKEPGRVRPCLDGRPDHCHDDRLRRTRHRPAVDPCPRGGGQARDSWRYLAGPVCIGNGPSPPLPTDRRCTGFQPGCGLTTCPVTSTGQTGVTATGGMPRPWAKSVQLHRPAATPKGKPASRATPVRLLTCQAVM